MTTHDTATCPDWCEPEAIDAADTAAGVLHASDWEGTSNVDGAQALTRSEITTNGPRVALAVHAGSGPEVVARFGWRDVPDLVDALDNAANGAAEFAEADRG